MTMLRLDAAQRAVLADKLPDLANLFAGGFVVGQYLGDGPVSIGLMLAGAVMWLGILVIALIAARGER